MQSSIIGQDSDSVLDGGFKEDLQEDIRPSGQQSSKQSQDLQYQRPPVNQVRAPLNSSQILSLPSRSLSLPPHRPSRSTLEDQDMSDVEEEDEDYLGHDRFFSREESSVSAPSGNLGSTYTTNTNKILKNVYESDLIIEDNITRRIMGLPCCGPYSEVCSTSS